MKVLLYSRPFLPNSGGVQTVVLELARGLQEWASRHPGTEPVEVTVVTQTAALPGCDDSYPFAVIRRPRRLALLRLMRAADVVHLAGPAFLPLALALLIRKPVVIEHHGFQAACPNGLLVFERTQTPCPGHFMAGHYGKCLECNRPKEGLLRSSYWLLGTHIRRILSNRAAVNITPTHWLGTILKLRRMKTVYHGISAPASSSDSGSPATFAFQGRLVSAKGAHLLLDAVEQLCCTRSGLRLNIIGEGPERKSLESRAATFGGAVRFLGYVSEEHLEEALADAGTVVMPSLGGEVFGLVAAENMLRGKLLIVSDMGALREVVGDTGMVFPAGDSGALGTCIRRALDEQSLAASLRSAARIRAGKLFDLDSMIRDHVALYQQAIST